jgi:hypothetical protein
LSTAVSSNNNLFENVTVKKFVTLVKSDNDIKNNTWTDCTFDTLWQGFAFGANTILGTSGMLTGPINNNILNCTFDNVYTYSIQVTNGTENCSKNNKFYNVGCNGGSAMLTEYPIIQFASIKNTSEGDWFQRSEELGYNEEYKNGVRYYPEVEGPVITQFGTTHKINISQSGEFSKLFRLPAETTKGYEIDYIYKSNIAGTRSGTMTLVVDPENDTYNFADDYEFTGNNFYADNLRFTAQLYDEDVNLDIDTVAIMMLNSTDSDNAVMHYKVKIKS